MATPNYVVSLSGKDSTAMLIEMLERRIPIHSIVTYDTGWEYQELKAHIAQVEAQTGLRVWRLHPRLPFEYWMTARPIRSNKTALAKLLPKELRQRWEDAREYNDMPPIPRTKKAIVNQLAGKIHRIGNGWPGPNWRWCTRLKMDAITYYCKPIPNAVSCVGIAADEQDRIKDNAHIKEKSQIPKWYPLEEWGRTQEDNLQKCFARGFTFGGIYEERKRLSCYCCPLQPVDHLKLLRRTHPHHWDNMRRMESEIIRNWGFKDHFTVQDYEDRFAREDKEAVLDAGTILDPQVPCKPVKTNLLT
jgi:3'-phosphoadenosine 5'-phosphosulfate sulfotransferase (PAPS reductase)/FAD synthetase